MITEICLHSIKLIYMKWTMSCWNSLAKCCGVEPQGRANCGPTTRPLAFSKSSHRARFLSNSESCPVNRAWLWRPLEDDPVNVPGAVTHSYRLRAFSTSRLHSSSILTNPGQKILPRMGQYLRCVVLIRINRLLGSLVLHVRHSLFLFPWLALIPSHWAQATEEVNVWNCWCYKMYGKLAMVEPQWLAHQAHHPRKIESPEDNIVSSFWLLITKG